MRDIKFIRWGNITPSKQFGYGKDSYHSPPAKKGLYAFPNEFVEPFLLGGFQFRDDRHEWVKKEDGSLITPEDKSEVEKYSRWCDFWECEELKKDYLFVHKTNLKPHLQFGIDMEERQEYPQYLAKWKKPKTFKHYGEIWTHWCPKNPAEILSVHNDSWYKVSYQTFVKLLQKRFAEERAVKKTNGWGICGDDCEVFIEKIVSNKH